MNISDYLKRININTPIGVNTQSLKLIQRHHLITVPFENVAIHTNKRLDVSHSALYTKIIGQNRGGICYELNYLLYLLLKEIGFDTKLLGGSVIETDNCFFDHLFLLVALEDKKYIVDVGFGDNFLEPLELILDKDQQDNKGTFKIIKLSNDIYALTKLVDSNYRTQYKFTLKEMNISDFFPRMEYFETSDHSIFKKNIFCSLERTDGRLSLKQDKLIDTKAENRVETAICSFTEYNTFLKDLIGIMLNDIEQEILSTRFQRGRF